MLSERSRGRPRASGREVIRLASYHRYSTATEIRRSPPGVADLNGRATAIIAAGLNSPDASPGGPIAAVGDGTGIHPIP